MLRAGKQGYEHTLRIYDTFCFSMAIIVTRTRLNNTLHVHCLSSFRFDRLTRRFCTEVVQVKDLEPHVAQRYCVTRDLKVIVERWRNGGRGNSVTNLHFCYDISKCDDITSMAPIIRLHHSN